MKIERINENKIKITISLNDLLERNIDLDSLNYNSPAAQELFWDMMEQAEIQFGFDPANSQLIVEASSDEDEGFIITITKVDDDGDFESIHKYIKNRINKKDLRTRRKAKKIYPSLAIYSFNSFDDLCKVCKDLSKIYTGESSIYKCRETYYLALKSSAYTVSNIKSFEALLNEFGCKIKNTAFFEGYLNEHSIKIIEKNAIEVINEYF